MLLARRFTLNPVLVIVSLVFWFWMWGVPGAILVSADAGNIEDRLRPGATLGGVWPLLGRMKKLAPVLRNSRRVFVRARFFNTRRTSCAHVGGVAVPAGEGTFERQRMPKDY